MLELVSLRVIIFTSGFTELEMLRKNCIVD